MKKIQERINHIKQELRKTTNNALEYIPDVAGASVSLVTSNPILGAVVTTASRQLLNRFRQSSKQTINFDKAMANNIKRFENAAIATSGTIQNKQHRLSLQNISDNRNLTPCPALAYANCRNNLRR